MGNGVSLLSHPSDEQILARQKVDLMAKRANFERLARKASQGNDAALRLLPKAKRLYIEARAAYEGREVI